MYGHSASAVYDLQPLQALRRDSVGVPCVRVHVYPVYSFANLDSSLRKLSIESSHR